MELNARLLSNTWFYSQGYQDELEFVAFGGRDDELQEERQNEQTSDPFVGWEKLGEAGELRDSFLNWQLELGHIQQAKASQSQLHDQIFEELPLRQSCTSESGENLRENLSDNSGDSSINNSSNSSMMEENYSDCFFFQCKDPFESLLTPKDEDFIEIDVERSSPPSIHESINRFSVDRSSTDRFSVDRSSTDRYSTDRYSTDRYSIDKYPSNPCPKIIERYSTNPLNKKQLLRKPQKMIEKSKRGRPQNSRPISQKAQISKDWREKKKLEDQQLQEKVCKLEVENGQLCKQNTKMKDEIRELRKLVGKLQKRSG